MAILRTCANCGKTNRVPARHLADTGRCGSCKSPLPAVAEPVAVGPAEFDEIVRESRVPILVDFWAAWCGPCRMVAPELEKLSADRAGRVVVAKVDTDALPEVAGRFGIRSIPTLIAFKGGRESKRVSGAMSASAIAQQLAV